MKTVLCCSGVPTNMGVNILPEILPECYPWNVGSVAALEVLIKFFPLPYTYHLCDEISFFHMGQVIDLIIYSARSNPCQEKGVKMSTYIIRISSSDRAKRGEKREDIARQETELVRQSKTMHCNELRSAGGSSVPATKSRTPAKTQARS